MVLLMLLLATVSLILILTQIYAIFQVVFLEKPWEVGPTAHVSVSVLRTENKEMCVGKMSKVKGYLYLSWTVKL